MTQYKIVFFQNIVQKVLKFTVQSFCYAEITFVFLSFRAYVPSSALPVLRNKTKHGTPLARTSQPALPVPERGSPWGMQEATALCSLLFWTSAFHQYPAGHFLYMFSPFHLGNRNWSFKIKCTNYFLTGPSQPSWITVYCSVWLYSYSHKPLRQCSFCTSFCLSVLPMWMGGFWGKSSLLQPCTTNTSLDSVPSKH